MRFMKQTIVMSLALALPLCASAISLSGALKDSATGIGLSGAKVSLVRRGLSTTTLSDGSWTLSGPVTGIASRHGAAAASGAALSVRNGHVSLLYKGCDLLGHSRSGSASTAASPALARSSNIVADTIDTLLFSWKNAVWLCKPITSYEQDGISAILDTSVSTAVAGDSGTFTDARDGQTYRYVKIGSQYWMAQNLNYRNTFGEKDTFGLCYDHLASNCAKYGRLYYWDDVVLNASSSNASPSGVQGICPIGWHAPSDTEWGTLIAYVGRDSARIRLSSKTGWNDNENGTDLYGFAALPAGGILDDQGSYYLGNIAFFWTSYESCFVCAYSRSFGSGATVYGSNRKYDRSSRFSLRCVHD
jgi:uncharacterized protein (TIGR02145 family)